METWLLILDGYEFWVIYQFVLSEKKLYVYCKLERTGDLLFSMNITIIEKIFFLIRLLKYQTCLKAIY